LQETEKKSITEIDKKISFFITGLIKI